jgi:hypothetical protein
MAAHGRLQTDYFWAPGRDCRRDGKLRIEYELADVLVLGIGVKRFDDTYALTDGSPEPGAASFSRHGSRS